MERSQGKSGEGDPASENRTHPTREACTGIVHIRQRDGKCLKVKDRGGTSAKGRYTLYETDDVICEVEAGGHISLQIGFRPPAERCGHCVPGPNLQYI